MVRMMLECDATNFWRRASNNRWASRMLPARSSVGDVTVDVSASTVDDVDALVEAEAEVWVWV